MRPFRTLLEQKIKERRQTLEEFAEYAEVFAREHKESGTLSLRHLQRLVAGHGPKGQPLGPVRPVTARLLEHIFGTSIDELLAPPATVIEPADDSTAELRHMLHASRQIDGEVIGLLHEQLTNIRRLDRQLGAVIVHAEVHAKAQQVTKLLAHSISPEVRAKLAALLSELRCLAGWQALDTGKLTESWRHYEQAKAAALESGIAPYEALAAAGQAFTLLDIGETKDAVDLLTTTRDTTDRTCSRLIRAWIAAAHGETLAANGQHAESLRAFDTAAALLPTDTTDPDGPYVALDSVHLARWRGHALARLADAEAIDVLSNALNHLDPTFTRAETALRVDLTTALAAIGEASEARAQAEHAGSIAAQIGSARQRHRLHAIMHDRNV